MGSAWLRIQVEHWIKVEPLTPKKTCVDKLLSRWCWEPTHPPPSLHIYKSILMAVYITDISKLPLEVLAIRVRSPTLTALRPFIWLLDRVNHLKLLCHKSSALTHRVQEANIRKTTCTTYVHMYVCTIMYVCILKHFKYMYDVYLYVTLIATSNFI